MHTLAVFRVILPLVGCIVARSGHLLVVWPNSPTHTVAVYTPAPRLRRVSTADVPPPELEPLVTSWLDDRVIVPCDSPSSVASLVALRAPGLRQSCRP